MKGIQCLRSRRKTTAATANNERKVILSTSTDQELVATLFNSQRHIDDFRACLTFNEMYKSDKCTFMLKHKHFDIAPGEVLFVEQVVDRYDVTVKNRKHLESSAKPCMWLFEFFWRPFAYTQGKHGYDDAPDLPPGNHNLGARWLNNGGTEHTYGVQKVQYVRPDPVEGEEKAIITFIHVEGDSGSRLRNAYKQCASVRPVVTNVDTREGTQGTIKGICFC